MATDWDKKHVWRAEQATRDSLWDYDIYRFESVSELRWWANENWRHPLGQLGVPPSFLVDKRVKHSRYNNWGNTIVFSETGMDMLTVCHKLAHSMVVNQTKHRYKKEHIERHGNLFRKLFVKNVHYAMNAEVAIRLETNMRGITTVGLS